MMTKKMSCAFGEWNDTREGIANIESRFPEKKIILVGACLGAMFIIDYLSTEEANRPSIGICFYCEFKQHY